MQSVILIMGMVLSAGIFGQICRKKLLGRIQALEQSLQSISDAVSQIAEVQNNAIKRSKSRFEDLEERLMDLCVPSQDASLPVEKRHKVLSLARQGMSAGDIAKRLKAPVGEAELIMNLSKYQGGKRRSSSPKKEQVGSYV
jgi:hypothetical protein